MAKDDKTDWSGVSGVVPPKHAAPEGIAAAIEAGRMLAGPQQVPDKGYVVLSPGCSLASVEQMQDTPARKRGMAVFHEERGFIDYVNDHKDAGTVIFADANELTMTCVLDYHVGRGKPTPATGQKRGRAAPRLTARPRWGGHRAWFAPPQHPDWIKWRDKDQQLMHQVTFAEFMEDMIPLMVKPDGATIMEVAQHLEVKRNVQWRSVERLKDGERSFVYIEEEAKATTTHNVEVPDLFTVKTPIFRGGQPVTFTAALRYRLKDGALNFGYRILRLTDIVDEAFQRLRDDVEKHTRIAPWAGRPPTKAEFG